MIVTDALRFISGRAVVWVKNADFADDYPTAKERCGLIDDMGKFIVPPIYRIRLGHFQTSLNGARLSLYL